MIQSLPFILPFLLDYGVRHHHYKNYNKKSSYCHESNEDILQDSRIFTLNKPEQRQHINTKYVFLEDGDCWCWISLKKDHRDVVPHLPFIFLFLHFNSKSVWISKTTKSRATNLVKYSNKCNNKHWLTTWWRYNNDFYIVGNVPWTMRTKHNILLHNLSFAHCRSTLFTTNYSDQCLLTAGNTTFHLWFLKISWNWSE